MGRRCKSRHRKCWVLVFGKAAGLLWCYECGAIRDLNDGSGRWTYPVGAEGENPALDLSWRRLRKLTAL